MIFCGNKKFVPFYKKGYRMALERGTVVGYLVNVVHMGHRTAQTFEGVEHIFQQYPDHRKKLHLLIEYRGGIMALYKIPKGSLKHFPPGSELVRDVEGHRMGEWRIPNYIDNQRLHRVSDM